MTNKFLKTSILIVALGISQQACMSDADTVESTLDEPQISDYQSSTLFQRGLTYELDGEEYYLEGALENGTRDIAGHDWINLGNGWVVGRHFNTGPFGIEKYWSSDAADDELLYMLIGRIDTWSEEKAEFYKSYGYVHYHEFVSVDDRTPHPSKVLWLKHIAFSSFTFDGGPMPWMAHEVEPGVDRDFVSNARIPYPPREEFLYVLAADKGGENPDFVAVIGANPDDPETFSKITHRVDMPELGDELHHFGFNAMQTRLLVPGLFSGRMHVLNIEDDPARPYIESWNSDLVADSGYIVPHTVIGTPDGGYMVSMIGSATEDTASGGIVKLDKDARFQQPFGPAAQRSPTDVPPKYMYDVGINVLRNRMVTTAFGLPADVGGGINPAGLGNEVYVWDYEKQEVLQVVDIGANTGALEVRWLNDPGAPIGFTNAPGTSEIWRWDDVDLDGHYEFSLAISLPAGSIPTDMLLSKDDKYLYVANWMGNNVMQYDITDPFNPVFVSQVEIPYAQMMRLSPDNKRLYITNSLLSTWDDTEFPAGVTRNEGYGMFLIDIDHENGGMTVSDDFFVDFDSVQKKNGVGPARPHQAFFDPNIVHGFGQH